MAHDVFISFKNSDENGRQTKDSEIANKLYDFLTDKGLRVFFSNVELEFTGKAQYTKVIDDALDTSRFLIAVGSNHNNLNSQWVRYEWESFLNDIRSGIKPNAEVFVFLVNDMRIDDLPRALRQQQAFDAGDKDSWEKLYRFIKNAVGRSETQESNRSQPSPVPLSAKNPSPKSIRQKPDSSSKLFKWAILAAIVAIVIGGVLLLNRPKTLNVIDIGNNNTNAQAAVDNRDNGVVINGVKWATRNVDKPGAFATNPEDAGMFYQWNRKVGWSATDPMINSDGGTSWDSSTPVGDTWEKSNDPSPAGWRVPTLEEIKTLLDENKVSNEWTSENGVNGRRFTDKVSGKSIFLPAIGGRSWQGGHFYGSVLFGSYWSCTLLDEELDLSDPSDISNLGAYAYHMNFYDDDSDSVYLSASPGISGSLVRCVAE